MIPRAWLLSLAPLALATIALAAREALHREGAAAPAPVVARALPTPPPLPFSASGTWRVLGERSALELTARSRGASRAAGAREISGRAHIAPDGSWVDLELLASIDPTRGAALLGAGPAGAVRLRAGPAPSSPTQVPGVRRADLRARLELDGRSREVALRAVWMACGPGLLRLQLESRWEGDARGEGRLLDTIGWGGRHSTLALDLALARS